MADLPFFIGGNSGGGGLSLPPGEPGQALFADENGQGEWGYPAVATFESEMEHQYSSGAGEAILYTFVLPDEDGNGGTKDGVYVQAKENFGMNAYLRFVTQTGERIVSQASIGQIFCVRFSSSADHVTVTIIQWGGTNLVYDVDVAEKTWTRRVNYGIPIPSEIGLDDGYFLYVDGSEYALGKIDTIIPIATDDEIIDALVSAGFVSPLTADGHILSAGSDTVMVI